MKKKHKLFSKNRYKKNVSLKKKTDDINNKQSKLNKEASNNKKINSTKSVNSFFKKYSTVAFSMLLVVVFVAVLSASYAFFTTTVKGKEFVIYTGTLAVNYAKKTDVINVENLYPMTNTQGLEQTSHEFTVTNDGNINARYQVRLELDNSLKDMISTEYIKLAYSIDGSNYSEPVLLSDLDSSLAFIRNMRLVPTEANTIGIKLWIGIDAPNEIQGKTFKAKVVVDSIQDVEDGFVVDTVPIIYLNKDDNGNQDMIIKTNSTYTDLGVNRIEDDKDIFTTSQVTKTYEYYNGTTTTTVSSVDTSKTGIYYITYSVADSDNNVGKAVRVVAVGDDETLKIYHDIGSVIASFNQTSLKEAIMCTTIETDQNTLYFDCRVHDTIENALASRTKGTVIMTSDIERDAFILINTDKEINLEVNSHTISFTSTYGIRNSGTLNINKESKGTIIGVSRPVLNYGTTNIYNGQYINTKVENDGGATLAVVSGVLNIYGDKASFDENGNYVSGAYIKGTDNSCINITGGEVNVYDGTIEMVGNLGAIRSNYDGTVAINIYDGEIISTNRGIGLDQNCSSTSQINVYGGTIHSDTFAAVYNNSPGTINIYSGVFVTNSNQNTIVNLSTGTININQTEKPLYITSLVQIWKPAINNASTGTINISGSEANKCTNNSSDTTSGLCIYAEGDKNYESNTSNTAISNTGDGIINISGGTMFGGHMGVSNHNLGTVNITGGNIQSGRYAVFNNLSGTINIQGGIFTSYNYSAIRNQSTGIINITQTNNPIYVTSLTQIWQPAVHNASTGTLNISGSEANKCTNNSSDTTSGLCIYAEGDKNYESNTSNTAVSNTGENGGIINISGGTMFGGYIGVSNHYNGTVNITGGYIESGKHAISNMRDGNINICTAKINSLQYDIWANSTSTGLINYSPSVIFTSGNNTPVIGGNTANIIPNYTGTCVSE